MPNLQILHFNDVYHLSPQKREPVGGVARFATAVKEFRQIFGTDSSSVLFSGDVFNPSVESTTSKGAHMVPAMNNLGIDAACFGNHDFDFGLPTLEELVGMTSFPWILSNVLDSESGKPIAGGCKVRGGWERENIDGSEGDDDIYVIKSGTDFREMSILEIDVEKKFDDDGEAKSIIKNTAVTRKEITSAIPEEPYFADLVKSSTSSITAKMSKPIAYTMTEWDCRSKMLRTQETAFGNFVADLMLYAYQPCISYDIDCSLLCAGCIRSDSIYPPGEITMGDLLEILPFEDPIVVVRISGQQLWDALESSVSMVPKQEGRFPIFSGLKVEYNSSAEPFHRLRNVWLTERRSPSVATNEDENGVANMAENNVDSDDDSGPLSIMGKLDMQKIYTVCTRAYMTAGNDGFKALMQPETQFLIDEENGMLLSTLVRRYFIGLYYTSAIKFNMSCESRTREAVLKAALHWKKLAKMRRKEDAHKHVSRRSIIDALCKSMGNIIKVFGYEEETSTAESEEVSIEEDTDKNDDGVTRKGNTNFVKDWVTIAPMIEGRIVTVDF
ncbi:10495_t:CDS:2 [Acaulospora colombiana]|uniref:10495_t:CDS:1 n=1 Tax=Acaulospora colombiana TaxID=27376 RepID=A0ACA9LEG9_9GLOM|nr:10495_t:CDS:2 [Acaulospora colombiana]